METWIRLYSSQNTSERNYAACSQVTYLNLYFCEEIQTRTKEMKERKNYWKTVQFWNTCDNAVENVFVRVFNFFFTSNNNCIFIINDQMDYCNMLNSWRNLVKSFPTMNHSILRLYFHATCLQRSQLRRYLRKQH